MSERLNEQLPYCNPPQDQFELEIDDLWQLILQDFENQELHQRLILLAGRYFLYDRVAKHYGHYLSQHPEHEAGRQFQKEVITASTYSLLQRDPNARKRERKSFRIIFPLILLIAIVALIVAGFQYRSIKKNLIAQLYEQGIKAMIKGNLEESRAFFEKVKKINPEYRDVAMQLAHITEMELERENKTPKPAAPGNEFQKPSPTKQAADNHDRDKQKQEKDPS
ncbi:hypothetical protein ACFL27_14430 [candidate division CSSED10-310 bacterium]|uniref:Tetratricopeptide repeat protein n=1 Tax=candidate division CSSED10-310 bacterium TaxID=2855610 RepID=A0ABV6YYW8_UNCC1